MVGEDDMKSDKRETHGIEVTEGGGNNIRGSGERVK